MADVILYDIAGNFQCVQRDGSMCFGPGSTPWADYVLQNGLPPATGTPTNKPARIPNVYTAMFAALAALPQAKQLQVMGSVCSFVLVSNPVLAAQINAAFTLNLPFDQANP